MSTPDPGTWLLNRIDAREEALTSQIEQARDQIEELTARLQELDQDLDHLRITRKTLLLLAAEPDPAPPLPPAPVVPDHPSYQQILTLMTGGQPTRARDLCPALDLPLERKNIENTRAKLKRLVTLGILVETEPGLFAQPRP
ncbi:hypothetical protein [Nonomuraea sp. NPDC049695]|uniref:hypothetical protein n=1 Tax=Nonomuraea sp. NPDC049695 TaxID=3154734 RepID=UPI0034285537